MRTEASDHLGRVTMLQGEPGRALLVFSHGSELSRCNGRIETLVVDEDSCDLTSLQTGRAPLLLDHYHSTDTVVGVIDGAWVEAGVAWAVARFGRSRRAQEVHQDVMDGILVNCSMGYRIYEEEAGEGGTPELPHARITRWRPYEISIVPIGADARAYVHPTPAGVDLGELLQRKSEECAARAQTRRLEGLKADAWRTWSGATARALAEEFDLSERRVHERLLDTVEQHLATLSDGAAA